MLVQDMGGCWTPAALRRSIVVSHFGFTGSEKLWTDASTWSLALRSRHLWRSHWNYSTLARCFTPAKDVVVPVYYTVPPGELDRAAQQLEYDCGGSAGTQPPLPKKNLLYMSGSLRNSASWYSQGVRDKLFRLHNSTPGVQIKVGAWHVADMLNSTFCLAPRCLEFE